MSSSATGMAAVIRLSMHKVTLQRFNGSILAVTITLVFSMVVLTMDMFVSLLLLLLIPRDLT